MFMIRYHFNMLKKVDYKMNLVSLTATKGTAMVTLKTVINGVTQDRGGKPGSPMTLTRVEKQVFVKKGSTWMMSLNKDIVPATLIMQSTPFGSLKPTTRATMPATGH
jgi:hypothetical protein